MSALSRISHLTYPYVPLFPLQANSPALLTPPYILSEILFARAYRSSYTRSPHWSIVSSKSGYHNAGSSSTMVVRLGYSSLRGSPNFDDFHRKNGRYGSEDDSI
ncbi:hypothetical protein HD806DRAFT_491324 [Xylariaceae sp. AK1471]|nr:hypothetical protein HD806DRAFT_491324 [Xylariaceae sp. AK1471]